MRQVDGALLARGGQAEGVRAADHCVGERGVDHAERRRRHHHAARGDRVVAHVEINGKGEAGVDDAAHVVGAGGHRPGQAHQFGGGVAGAAGESHHAFVAHGAVIDDAEQHVIRSDDVVGRGIEAVGDRSRVDVADVADGAHHGDHLTHPGRSGGGDAGDGEVRPRRGDADGADHQAVVRLVALEDRAGGVDDPEDEVLPGAEGDVRRVGQGQVAVQGDLRGGGAWHHLGDGLVAHVGVRQERERGVRREHQGDAEVVGVGAAAVAETNLQLHRLAEAGVGGREAGDGVEEGHLLREQVGAGDVDLAGGRGHVVGLVGLDHHVGLVDLQQVVELPVGDVGAGSSPGWSR